jgi:predicted secreted protein
LSVLVRRLPDAHGVAVLLLALSMLAPGAIAADRRQATLAAQAAEIEVTPGEHVDLKLDADRTTGRRWWLAGIEGDAVALHGSPVFASPNVRALQVPGVWVFDIVAVSSGRASVRFDYRRENEEASLAERTATFRFVVR